MVSLKKTLLWLGLLLIIATLLAAIWAWQQYEDFERTALPLDQDGLVYVLAPGTSLRALAHDLHQRQLIVHPLLLRILARQTGLANRLKAGEYHIAEGTTPRQLLQQLSTGKVLQHELTLVEGHTFRQMMARINEHPALQHQLQELPDDEIMSRLGYSGEHPEGRFLPDTYHFPRGTSDVDFLKRAYTAMEQVLQQAWASRDKDLPLKTPYEALILASIVPEERATIAGVFTRRLQKGMRLQTDPTVIYGIGETFDGDIRYRDLRRDTPYNTYTRAGLPPTPIAMPGRDAIHASVHPAPGKALYFVATGDGRHYFSATLAEHNRAVNKYQKRR